VVEEESSPFDESVDDEIADPLRALAALLEASNGTAASECTLLRGGAKVTIALGEPRASGKPTLAVPAKPVTPSSIAASAARPQPPASPRRPASPRSCAQNSRPQGRRREPSRPARERLRPKPPRWLLWRRTE